MPGLRRIPKALLIAWGVGVSVPVFACAGGPIVHPFKIADAPLFRPALRTLNALIAQKSKTTINHVCVIGQDLPGSMQEAWVYWREGDAIILWQPTRSGLADLARSPRYLHLKTDAVGLADPALKTSTYLVSRRWAHGLIDQCRKQGTRFTIDKVTALKTFKSSELLP